MNYLEIIKARYSCRKYRDQNISIETLLSIAEAGRIAPSAVNYQPWHFVILPTNNDVNTIAEAYPRDWFKLAPAAIVVCVDHQQSWKRADGKDHADIDAAIAADHISLRINDLGLDSCWVCNFDLQKCKELLQLPESIEPVIILPLGIPADQTEPNRHDTKRKPLTEIVSIGLYGKKL
jgi:nitroreductase